MELNPVQLKLEKVTLETPIAGMWSMSCDYAGARFHFWIDPKTQQPGMTLYKNPKLNDRGTYRQRGDEGWFETRKLNTERGVSRIMVQQMMAMLPMLLPDAQAERDAKLAQAQAEQAQAERLHRMQEAAPEMHALLVEMVPRITALREASGNYDEDDMVARAMGVLLRVAA
jgi:hypothetical protein